MLQPAHAAEHHVSVNGSDNNPGTASKPFATISAAAEVAQPGDTVTVHGGTYRERVDPPRGGTSDEKRIVYRAAEGETVRIKGSEVIDQWEHVRGGVWKVTLANEFFGPYNPYKDRIRGDWFDDRGRVHHTGQVYLNGRALFEKASREQVFDPKPHERAFDREASTYTWYCRADGETTTIWANFHEANPNEQRVEINVRKACFYPDEPGRDYITVRGFRMSQAATQWAAPTAEQIGLIGTHWSKGWVIENNTVRHSRCVGITLGKGRKTGHNVYIKNPDKSGADHYNETIRKALRNGWSRKNIGSHVVRNNTISRCGAAGICGSLGAIFSRIVGNHVHHIYTQRQFGGAEMAAIKLHGAIDTVIRGNRVHDSGSDGLWLDWMSQGTRVTRNLFYANRADDLFLEVNHGPFVIDHNILLSDLAIRCWSEGGAYVHNLIAGNISFRPAARRTPYLEPHSTRVAGLSQTRGGDNRFYNNVFINSNGLAAFENAEYSTHSGGNVYFSSERGAAAEPEAVDLETGPQPRLIRASGRVRLRLNWPALRERVDTRLITTEVLGEARVPGLPYLDAAGSRLVLDEDYNGRKRDAQRPTPGPFKIDEPGPMTRTVWQR